MISVNLGRPVSDTNRDLLLTVIYDLVLIFLDVNDVAAFAPIKYLKKKHRKYVFTIVKSFESAKAKYAKILIDIKFIKACKQEYIIPTFANVELSIKGKNNKLKHRIARIIMEDEMTYKCQQKQKLKKDIKRLSMQLKSTLHIVVYSVLLHQANLAVKSKSKVISIQRHSKKLLKLQQSQKQWKKTTNSSGFIRKEEIHNCSSYVLSKDEHDASSCGLDHHIPGNVTRNEINTEFELF